MMTSTWSLGRMKPPAEVSAEICTETARLPAGRIADMKPRSALISLASRTGSPAKNDWRAIEPFSSSRAFGRFVLVMRVGPMPSCGHFCQPSEPSTLSPMARSLVVTRTSESLIGGSAGAAVMITGSEGSGCDSLSARKPAPAAATRATATTAMRATLIEGLPVRHAAKAASVAVISGKPSMYG